MKILRLLSKKFILFFLYLFFVSKITYSNEPVDIWNLEKNNKNDEIKKETVERKSISIDNSTNNQSGISITEQNDLSNKKNYLVGLYDPAENDLTINMWEFTDGEKILKIIKKIHSLNLSDDAKEIYNNLILTNALPPKKNFTTEQFLQIKIDWLIKNEDLNLIFTFIENNNEQEANPLLLRFYLDQHLSKGDLENACKIFSSIKNLSNDNYVSKFEIYCLINNKKKELAQIQFDLLKEQGFKDKFFEKKFNFLMGYNEERDTKISEKDLLAFHLSHITDPDFKFKPKDDTNKIIWSYLSSFNLLEDVNNIDLEDEEKIRSIEKATHERNYSEKDLLKLYTRYKFSINQLISIEESSKLLSDYQSRALLYQGFLISTDTATKIQLLKLLKENFNKSSIENAFNFELVKFLEELKEEEIPYNYIDFYNYNLADKKNSNKKIKFNNKIIHQSKLLNYFSNKMEIKKAEKELKKFLKKINKKYYISTKDIIVIESLINDGVMISEKTKLLLELYSANIPTDIEVMINDGEIAMILLRLVEIIGEDDLKDLGSESLYFIISTLNKLNIDKIRNDIILKVLPLKVQKL